MSVTSRRAGQCVRDQLSSRARDAVTNDLCPENEAITTVVASYSAKSNVVYSYFLITSFVCINDSMRVT